MHTSLGRPPVMLVDLRPVSSAMLVVGSYEVAEQIAKASTRFPYSPPKVPEIWNHMIHLSGPTSIMSSGVSRTLVLTRLCPPLLISAFYTRRAKTGRRFAKGSIQDLLPSTL